MDLIDHRDVRQRLEALQSPANTPMDTTSLRNAYTYVVCLTAWEVPAITCTAEGYVLLEWRPDRDRHIAMIFLGGQTVKVVARSGVQFLSLDEALALGQAQGLTQGEEDL